MGLSHVVVTSVDRDDLPDRGAEHWAKTIRALRRRLPDATIEVLTPDFLGQEEQALATVLAAGPDVFNHNIETCRRIQPKVRIKGDYERALALLRRAREMWAERYPERGPLLTKSGIVAGMGESDDEIIETMRDLRDHDVDVVTIGQYLQPSPRHLPLDRWVPLESFRRFREEGEAMGFGSVFSGPLVRSSYRADEQQLAARGESRVVTL
jgi:lipoic acid synthetase